MIHMGVGEMTGPQQPYGQQPPYGQPYQPYPPVPPQRKRAKWPFVLAGVAVLMLVLLGGCIALIGAAANEVDDNINAQASADAAGVPAGPLDHAEDVTITVCGPDPTTLNWGKATVDVTNGSSEPSTYSLEILFESPDGATLHATGYAFVPRLEPGQTTTQEVVTGEEVPVGTVCRLTSAQRTRDY